MSRHASMAAFLAVAVALTAAADVPPASRLRTNRNHPAAIPPGETVPVLPDLTPTGTLQQGAKKERGAQLRPESRIELHRYINKEFARAVRALPTVKNGYRIKVGTPVNEESLRQTVRRSGSAANPGDTVQITDLRFGEKEIILDINGGAKEKKRWRDRIQVQVSGPVPRASSGTVTDSTPGYQRVGSTLILDFGKSLPDLSPDEFKQILAEYLDFSKQRSASVHWFETLPPEYQEAVKEKKAVVGMDREMVIAAMGRPDHKVRERDPDGVETEDWIYGQPPGKTVFVKFVGDKVIAVREFPR